jgi:hypothetical protein
MAASSAAAAPEVTGVGGATDEELWLLGLPTLRNYLDYVADAVVGGSSIEPSGLVTEWRRANTHYQDLARREAGLADSIERRPLPPSLREAAEELHRDGYYRRSFNSLPTRLAMVEIDKLVVCQSSVSGDFVHGIGARIDPSDERALFDFCMALDRELPQVELRRAGSRRFVFRCVSTDFRFHEAAVLRPSQLAGHESFGPVAGAVALVVGFGGNFMSAIEMGDRLLLHNGYHRACALRANGVTHAPCVIQTASHPDELQMAAKRSVADDPEFYFERPRPPLLKDYFDPAIRKPLRVHRQVRTLELTYELRDALVSA